MSPLRQHNAEATQELPEKQSTGAYKKLSLPTNVYGIAILGDGTMARAKYASLRADMIKTVRTERAVYLSPDENGDLVRHTGWAILPGKAA